MLMMGSICLAGIAYKFPMGLSNVPPLFLFKSVNLPGEMMTAAGILEDLPEYSHIQADYVVPFWALKGENWTDITFDLYLQSKGAASVQEIGSKIQGCIKKHDPRPVSRLRFNR